MLVCVIKWYRGENVRTEAVHCMSGLFVYNIKGDQYMNVERVELSKLKLDSRNARKHSDRNIKEIKRSLAELGQHRALVVQRKTGRILVGNGMYRAMLQLGWTEGDVYFVDDDDKQALRRALADNRTGELAEWDMDALTEELGELDGDVIGWNEGELEALLKPDDDTGPEITEVEIKPYRKVNFLINADLIHNARILDALESLRDVDGIIIKTSAN